MFRPGDHIGPFELIQKIGRGAFGEVWLAEEQTAISSHRVALKLPNNEDVDLEAIRQEARVWEQVKGHPNILPVIRADIADGQIYLASEYAPDGSLNKWLKIHGGKAPDIESARRMMSGILAGLRHLHAKEIVHRDLKPENILLQAQTPRIADFGIARLIRSVSSSTVATGTPAYMAPECFYGTRSEKTDLWAAGVIFHKLLTGKMPFPQPDQVSVMNAILNGSPEIDASLPVGFRYIIGRALEKNPIDRYVSATEMAIDLESYGDGARSTPRQFSGITIPTSDSDDEFETKVVPKLSTNGSQLHSLSNPNYWKVAAGLLGILLVGIGGVWAAMLLASNNAKADPEYRYPSPSQNSQAASQSVVPVAGSNADAEADLQQPGVSTNRDVQKSPQVPSNSIPGGDGYNAWANAVPTTNAPPANAPRRNNAPPGYRIDPNEGSQFMPLDPGVILVPVPANANAAKPMATPQRKKPTPQKAVSDDCRYNGNCNK